MPPTIILIPGAWLTPTFYQPFLRTLTSAGYPTHYAAYPSLDPSNPHTADCQTDTNAITTTTTPFIDAGQDVILFMHSYAGMPGSAAAAVTDLAKPSRSRQGKKGGILGLVFLAGFLVPEGVSCTGAQGGNLPNWILLDQPAPDLNVPDDVINTFAGDVDPHLVAGLEENVKPHSTLAFRSAQPHPAWADEAFAGRLAFIVTTEDKAISKEAQDEMQPLQSIY
ncbi:hypothetical protein MW887_006228 [Aspergillus wentii]|nr:hypothetical protein MW887_006228 [Aspergillus wentii]